MSVRVHDRKPSQFEVFHQAYELRHKVTDLLLRNFAYKKAKSKMPPDYDKWCADKQNAYLHSKAIQDGRRTAFEEWFIEDERKAVMEWLRQINAYIHAADSIVPQSSIEEYNERRLYQDKAIGACNNLKQELQYVITELPVDINQYTKLAEMIDREIALIKGWRKSDNKYKKRLVSDAEEVWQKFINFITKYHMADAAPIETAVMASNS